MGELKADILKRLKIIKGIDSEDSDRDDVFLLAIESAIFEVLSYCHLLLNDWSDELNNTVVFMALDILHELSFTGDIENAEGGVKSITEGDFTISKETEIEAYKQINQLGSVTGSYKKVLNRYRKLA